MLAYFKSPLYSYALFKLTYFFLSTIVLTTILTTDLAAQYKKNEANDTSFNNILKKFDVGVAGGFSLNQFVTAQPQTGSNTGFTAGGSLNYKFYRQFGLQLEANFLQQGGKMVRFKDDTRIGLPESFETKNVKNSSYVLNSVEIPLLINYTWKIKQTWKPKIYVGGSYAHTLNVIENYQKTGDLLPGEDIIATAYGSQNVTGVFNSNRFNIVAGASVMLPLYAKLMLMLDFRYLTGLTSVRDNYSYMDKVGFGSDVRTNSFVSKIGVVFPLAKK